MKSGHSDPWQETLHRPQPDMYLQETGFFHKRLDSSTRDWILPQETGFFHKRLDSSTREGNFSQMLVS